MRIAQILYYLLLDYPAKLIIVYGAFVEIGMVFVDIAGVSFVYGTFNYALMLVVLLIDVVMVRGIRLFFDRFIFLRLFGWFLVILFLFLCCIILLLCGLC